MGSRRPHRRPESRPTRAHRQERDHRANSSRGVIKVAAEQSTGASSITAQVADTEGLKFEKLDWAGITQPDRLDGTFAVVVRAGADQRLDLETLALP